MWLFALVRLSTWALIFVILRLISLLFRWKINKSTDDIADIQHKQSTNILLFNDLMNSYFISVRVSFVIALERVQVCVCRCELLYFDAIVFILLHP